MTRAAALIDAAMTVQLMHRGLHPRCNEELRTRRHVGRTLGCPRTWEDIQDEIVRRLLAEPDRREAA